MPDQISVLFVCLGNICRSTMAAGVFQSMAKKAPYKGLIAKVDSCGTGGYHIDESPDDRTMSTLEAHGITDYVHAARKVNTSDFDKFDYIFAMDRSNLSDLERMKQRKSNSKAKVMLFGEYSGTGKTEVISDPYYGGRQGFEKAYEQATRFSKNFLKDVAAVNNQTNEGVAIKKVTNVFSKKILAKRALREIKLLQHFRGHRNITCLYDMDIPRPDNFNETYLYEELMECDLAAIIRSGQPLTDAHFQSFIYQILCGLKYIHSANVLHRDLKPGNLLVNADCELKICDFGLARGFSVDPEENAGYMTEYVATRWYRAPEIMLSFQSYTKAIDVWSVGCILAELLGGRPFFKGRDYVDQLNQILHILGTPNEETLSRIGSPRAQEYVRNLPFMPKKSFPSLFPNANPDALDLLDRMLAFDPSSRISVETALEHPYLAIWHDASDEPDCPTTFDFDFEVVEDVGEMRKMILDEVFRFRQLVRTAPGAGGPGGPGQQPPQVPIPSANVGHQWTAEDPRPQEYMGQMGGLEGELGGR
ncbi:cmgc mapk erk1 protein kinase [Diplogelasinospora grovesii]|uniref:Cmgc mapk erk1 protein kinase n=1 Tax=Diplogelasinospora grovesii TaxID=303347 RepID=A0AAN6NEF2_9PEZI|nr:cmgc mapk erk1 protein kinase [Diplogelasinospora grovesii]